MKSDSSTSSTSSTPVQLLEQLSANSSPYQDPIARVDWHNIDPDKFWLPEEALSLYGLPEFMNSPIEQRIKLSHYEFLYLLEVNLWLESLFMGRLCEATRVETRKSSLAKYHLHELREAAGHGLLFLELVHHAGLERVPVNDKSLLRFERLYKKSALESLRYWAATLMGEELCDRMNRLILKNADMICPVVVSVIKYHTIDQFRHITHSKNMVSALSKPLTTLQKFQHRIALQRLLNQFIRVLYFPSANTYDLAGLMPGRCWADLAWHNAMRHRFIRQQLESTLRPLQDVGMDFDWYS